MDEGQSVAAAGVVERDDLDTGPDMENTVKVGSLSERPEQPLCCGLSQEETLASSLKGHMKRSVTRSFDTTTTYSFLDSESSDANLFHELSLGEYVEETGEEITQGFYLWGSSHQIPLEEGKMWKNGEDSCFVSPVGAGVADGVGEWGEVLKINPKKFADELMGNAETLLGGDRQESADLSPSSRASRILAEAHQRTKSFGSSTALVAVVEGSKLGIANVGDSAAMVFRRESSDVDREAVLWTSEKQHTFNMPYQLSRVPELHECDTLANKFPELVDAVRRKADGESLTLKRDGVAREECELREGDLVVLCTDGVTDNLWPSRISSILSQAVSPVEARNFGCSPTPPEKIASILTNAALEKSKMTRRYKSPFAAAFRAHYGTFYAGGKPDDITVVAAWVMSSSCLFDRQGTFSSLTTSKSSESL
ncbi:protein phosphatase 2c, putative [Perkinsus marinus ATCC 50983]|uniref:Protein phosphatase n=1 Tax=Perkinsus marinus (strain ATCC 50983 / TXsc) TaxID=423536 RepID=C5KD98_PERM5|nr:protein phosphatase 2c, putative [Perkinsus marinus ATCC 50983]EER17531.1 protein phosphatase 2c, putative [Perkinsus marinus ATCC 50983]|eukprot:XP_002785735.1 protein phosphatase 2c, putative [Perkinsus marinus ATCC 50983]